MAAYVTLSQEREDIWRERVSRGQVFVCEQLLVVRLQREKAGSERFQNGGTGGGGKELKHYSNLTGAVGVVSDCLLVTRL